MSSEPRRQPVCGSKGTFLEINILLGKKKGAMLRKPVFLFSPPLEDSADRDSYWVLGMQAGERTIFLQKGAKILPGSVSVLIYLLGSSMRLKKGWGCVNGKKNRIWLLNPFNVCDFNEVTSDILSAPCACWFDYFLVAKSMELNHCFCRLSTNTWNSRFHQ